MEKIPKFDEQMACNKAVGPGNNPKLINLGPTYGYSGLQSSFIIYFDNI